MTDERFLLKDFFNRETIGIIAAAVADASTGFDRGRFSMPSSMRIGGSASSSSGCAMSRRVCAPRVVLTEFEVTD